MNQVLHSTGLAQEVFAYVTSSRGKGLRPSLVFQTFDLCGGTRFDEVIDSAAGVELVHMASLIHDDIVDCSERRRGRLALHRKFGTPAAVLAGDRLFAAAFGLFALSTTSKVSRVMTEVIEDMCVGEIDQLLSPMRTKPDYLAYIHRKTACLIGGCCRLGAILADANEVDEKTLKEYGENIGLAFQLTDDVLDYQGAQEVMGKDGGRDYSQRLWTLPTILAYEKGLISHTWFTLDFASLRDLMERHYVFDEVWTMAAGYLQKATAVLERFPDCPAKTHLKSLAKKLLNRRS